MLCDDRLVAARKIDEPVITKKVGGFHFEQVEDGNRQPAYLDVGRGISAHFKKMAHGRWP